MVWIERHFICYYEGDGNLHLCVFSYNACLKASRLLNYIENMGSYVTPNTTSVKIPIIYCCLVEQRVLYCWKYMEDVNTLFGHMHSFVMLHQMVRIVTTLDLKRLL
jgi:hypothetical protein